MRILVTGATGFTGRHFIAMAREQGHQTYPLRSSLLDASAVTQEVCELQPTAVVHLAGISFVGHASPVDFYAVNTVGTTVLLDALCKLPTRPTEVLVASSANVYGNTEVQEIDETVPPAPVNHYAMSKLSMEHMARTYGDRLSLCITRPFNYTGPQQSERFVIPKIVAHFQRRADRVELGNMHVLREYNDVRLVCDAYLKLLSSGVAGETYNVCTGITYSLQQVIAALEELTGHTIEVVQNPAFSRPTEVHRLRGSSNKLESCIGTLSPPSLKDTLQWMLQSEQSIPRAA